MIVGPGHHARHDVVVVPAAEVLVLQAGAVVQPVVELSGERSVEHPAGGIQRGKVRTCYVFEPSGLLMRRGTMRGTMSLLFLRLVKWFNLESK